MVTRREFFRRGVPLAAGLPAFLHAGVEAVHAAAIRHPARNYVLTGLRAAEAGRAANIPPVPREEILDNPDAVFIIRTAVSSRKTAGGWFPAEREQMEEAGLAAARAIFRKGSGRGGTTFIKPNFVNFAPDPDRINNGMAVHPSFVAGFCSGLKDLGNTNIIACANGAASHDDFVRSGIARMMEKRGVVLVEGRYGSFDDYVPEEVVWVDYPEGVVMRKIPYFPFVQDRDTTFIDMAKTRIHQLGFTTLTMKNLQGVMPVGYMHLCHGWGNLLKIRKPLRHSQDAFNPGYQREIERRYVRHANQGFKYWDEGGYCADYFGAGGWDSFRKGGFEPHERVFWGEHWGQSIADVAANVRPALAMVEGIFGIDGANEMYLNNFITASRSMVACDAVAAWMMGQDPRELPYLRIANERGLGPNDIAKIKLYELKGGQAVPVRDYRVLPRARMGVRVYGIADNPLRFF